MKKFLYETHCHTSESSGCGKLTAKQICDHYKNLGYDGITVTDHMVAACMEGCGCVTTEEKAEHFLAGYRAAKKEETENFKVLLGMEIRFLDASNDYLLYGFDEDFVYKYDFDLFANLKSFRPIVEENSLMIFQAHPFRVGMKISDPKYLDGMEIYNGNANHHSNNDLAALWAKKFGLRPLSGSDFHGNPGTPFGGVYFRKQICDSKTLVAELRSHDYEIK